MEYLPNEVLTELKEYIIFKPKTKQELVNAFDSVEVKYGSPPWCSLTLTVTLGDAIFFI